MEDLQNLKYKELLSSVAAERLSSLVSSVTGAIFIKNVSGCNLVNILVETMDDVD